ncbi:putative Guanylate kinase [Candidatus Hydrogenisulfobacillus filiaventi]|uniref:Putative Guanylate kinase n=1 Tax=Candidatus Hydrogenisulfobacillus filiaventi TaxID=2707344 RepID=A0A6F8ZCS0_9FIRM|nr:putative Guanylate kinase [Candidatus Hydrogenisulfobacillus filiaventi]
MAGGEERTTAGAPYPVVLVVGPSGVGKNAVIRAALAQGWNAEYVPSYTSRPPRSGEREGDPYHFVSEADFQALAQAGDLWEWTQVHGNWYGSGKRALAAPRAYAYAVTDMDLIGAWFVKTQIPHDAILVFVLPPSWAELRRRMAGQAGSAQDLYRRWGRAMREMQWTSAADLLIVNQDVQQAARALRTGVEAYRRSASVDPPLPATCVVEFEGGQVPVPALVRAGDDPEWVCRRALALAGPTRLPQLIQGDGLFDPDGGELALEACWEEEPGRYRARVTVVASPTRPPRVSG